MRQNCLKAKLTVFVNFNSVFKRHECMYYLGAENT